MAEYINKEDILRGIDSAVMWNLPVSTLYKDIEEIELADVSQVQHGRWEWFEEWSPSTPDHPRECEDYGWRCSRCKTSLEAIVGGYWDNPDDVPEVKFCPNCGAKMDLEVTTDA